MLAHSQTHTIGPLADDAAQRGAIFSLMQKTGAHIMEWAKVCARYYAAASAYEQLSALSNAELARRGLSRATLAGDVSAAYDR